MPEDDLDNDEEPTGRFWVPVAKANKHRDTLRVWDGDEEIPLNLVGK
ncbi:hypothetical protein [Saccharopolyspora pogona]|nr:hypothetical protein [Saccharopolyspora pogona]